MPRYRSLCGPADGREKAAASELSGCWSREVMEPDVSQQLKVILVPETERLLQKQ